MKEQINLPETGNSPARETPAFTLPAQRYFWLGLIIAGYIGIYLCRKNFSVAIPILQKHFSATRAEIGLIASYSTIAYAIGKFFFGAVVDRIGGRKGFLGAMLIVALFGVAGGLAPNLALLTVFYSANRFVAAGAWPGMVKMVPSWFEKKTMPFAMAWLSLSFVAGGACATMFAGTVAQASGNNWRAIMALPSGILLLLFALNAWLLPRDSSVKKPAANAPKKSAWAGISELLAIRQFWVVCALSFTLTLLRETFNTWLVDFIRTEGGATVSNQVAAFLSTPFDILGAIGILAMGWVYGKLRPMGRKWLLFSMLNLLGILIFVIPTLFARGLGFVTVAIGLIGFLVYGPYSLLAGTLAVEIRGQERVGTVSGIIDGVGYAAGILAGAQFGKIVDMAGYVRGFEILSVLAVISAFLCFLLYPRSSPHVVE